MKARFRRSDVEEAVERLDGVVGWLTLFGYKYATEGVRIEGFIDLAVSLVGGVEGAFF